MKNETEISKEQIQTYEDIRQSGLTNMFNVTAVVSLSDGILTKEDCYAIMHDYSKLIEKHNISRE